MVGQINGADLYGGRAGMFLGQVSATEAASGGEYTDAAGALPTIWWVGLVIALVFLRVMYEVA